MKIRVLNLTNQKYLGEISPAYRFKARMKGLLGTKELSPYHGLMIKPCKQVHTIGMNYPLSVWFIDHNHKILKIIDELKPYRISPYIRNTRYIIEFPAKWAEKTGSGEGNQVIIL